MTDERLWQPDYTHIARYDIHISISNHTLHSIPVVPRSASCQLINCISYYEHTRPTHAPETFPILIFRRGAISELRWQCGRRHLKIMDACFVFFKFLILFPLKHAETLRTETMHSRLSRYPRQGIPFTARDSSLGLQRRRRTAFTTDASHVPENHDEHELKSPANKRLRGISSVFKAVNTQ
jgi:hypothetical protein